MITIGARRAVRSVVASSAVALFACGGIAKEPGHPVASPEAKASTPRDDSPGASESAASMPRDYPTRAVRLVIPFAKGGGADVWGRFVATKLGERLGQPFEIEDVPGRGGNDGTEAASKVAPNGYTLLLGSIGPLVVHPLTYRRLPFDAEKDFVPVGLLESSPLLLLVHDGVKASSVDDLLSLAKATPGQLAFATNGNGSPEQVAGELFVRLAKIDVRDVPYDGAGPARRDLSKGNVTMMFDVCKAAMDAVRDGKQRPLAVADKGRSNRLPDVPTLGELGYPELQIRIWTGLFAPRGTPSAVVARLSGALRQVLGDDGVRRAIEDVGGEPMPMSPDEVDRFLAAERANWRRLVRDSGVPRVDGPI